MAPIHKSFALSSPALAFANDTKVYISLVIGHTQGGKVLRYVSLTIPALCVAIVWGQTRPAIAQFYTQHNLVSDGAASADCVDPNLVDGWGIAAGPTSPWWISDAGTGKTSLYSVDAVSAAPPCPAFTAFAVPGAGVQSAPTGVVRNDGTGFVVNNGVAGSPSAAGFILGSADGTISAYRGDPLVVVVNNSATAAYTGLAIVTGTATGDFLYAANFRAGTVDVFDTTFTQINSTLSADAFTDPSIPAGYAPFGIQNLGGVIYVTYALKDSSGKEVPGEGHGFVNVFDTSGKLLYRVASKGRLNSPWGLALVPFLDEDADPEEVRPYAGFFNGALLIGNMGDGKINAFDPTQHAQGEYVDRGPLLGVNGKPIVIEKLRALAFGTDSSAGGKWNTLFFTAGSADGAHGLFGSLVETVGDKRGALEIRAGQAGENLTQAIKGGAGRP
ncbi:conserved hypothetical protein [Methylocella silvestris BL2]|uniref:TIGR03118 family protein n=1 Tax=Methylocella silvestris (strain DSM 15510 / CIP 108128 / LMG 27833 / NCIMB 13906 / BL2) TaxID=395965 RepID=B8ER77_METSB|nr:TIGR03118 family protein [Methylocella silvestris]ACK50261.1 conserved hypothetical protein [Methylocella silvestris BL2]